VAAFIPLRSEEVARGGPRGDIGAMTEERPPRASAVPSPERLDEAVVPEERAGERLDRCAFGLLAGLATVTHAKKAAKRGELLLNGEVATSHRRVRPGDLIRFIGPQRPPPPVFEIPIEVPWQDGHMAVVVKPPGLVVSGNLHRSLEHALLPWLEPSTEPDALPWPRPVHRLDLRTGGLVMVAKTARARAALGRILEQREASKRYRALVLGRLEGEGVVDLPVDGRASVSRYRAVEHSRSLRTDWLTTVDLWPVTGRTHQLRQHVAAMGHPVLGDELYGTEGSILRGAGLFLWAVELSLDHPITGEPLHVAIDEPYKFASHRAREARRWQNYEKPDSS
jgi:23S rRNA pseudouridine1911/1915/1917 synthase